MFNLAYAMGAGGAGGGACWSGGLGASVPLIHILAHFSGLLSTEHKYQVKHHNYLSGHPR